jgi:hypothetical protein
MRFAIALALGSAALLLVAPAAAAQVVYIENTAPVAVYPATPFAQYPRVERALQFVADPWAARARNRGQSVPYSDHPFIDAAPNIVNLASIALLFRSTPTLIGLAFAVPPAIRAARVVLYGSPVEGRRDTLLWIVEPTILHVRDRMRDRRGGGQAIRFCR